MRYCLGMSCVALIVFVGVWLSGAFDRASVYDLHVVEAPNGNGLAVITPDPFFDDSDWEVRVWRLEIHMRLGNTTIHEELFIRASAIESSTVRFVETAWGTELHVLEAHPDLGSGQLRRRRWVARGHGLEELQSARGFGPFS